MCNYCVFTIGKNLNEKNEFMCSSCQKMHLMPSEDFPIVIPLLNLLRDQLKCCEKEKKRKDMLDYLKANMKWIEEEVKKIEAMVKKNGADYIHDHCTELRRLVQLSTEEKILRLNDLNEIIISKIDVYEKKAIEKFNQEKMNYFHLEKMQLNSKQILDEAVAYIAGFRIHDEHVHKTAIKTDHFKEQLKYEFEKFDRSLFNRNKMNFKVINSLFFFLFFSLCLSF